MAPPKMKHLFPKGACTAKTEHGKRCQAREVYENNRCRFHGGEGRPLRVMLKVRRESDRTLRQRVYNYLLTQPALMAYVAYHMDQEGFEPERHGN